MPIEISKTDKGYIIEIIRSYGLVTYRVKRRKELRRWLKALKRKGARV